MDTTREIEAQAEALLADGAEPSDRKGVTRLVGILTAVALVAVGAGSAWHGSTRASPDGIVQLRGPGMSGVCSHDGWDCRDTKCCINPASQCYKKNEHWGSCNATCSKNMKWENGWVTTDKEEDQWACDELTKENVTKENVTKENVTKENVAKKNVTSGSGTVECAAAGESCFESKCCADAYHTCFKKSEHWASCNATCSNKMKWVGSQWEEQDEHVWDCDEITDERKKDTTDGETAEDICVKAGENCMLSKCCSQEGHTCFKKDSHWASCNLTCSNDYKWTNGMWVDQGEQVWACDELTHDDKDGETSFCDMSGCQDAQCREVKERDCCLERLCPTGMAGDESQCQADNMATCCEGKSTSCNPDVA